MTATAPSRDILRIFPYEIWSKCVLLAIDRAPEGPLPFLSVSPHWQRLLLDSPVMWSYIHIEGEEDTMDRVNTFLHLSGQHPLELATTLYGPIWNAIKPTILLHSERIYSISVLGWGSEKNTGSELLGTASWPMLRIISSPNTIFPAGCWEYLFESCPNMQYYRCISFTNDDCRWPGKDTREVKAHLFNITPRLSEFGQQLLRLPRLEKIDLSIGSPISSEQSEDTLHSFVLSSKNLRDLILYTCYSTVLEGIFKSSLGLLDSMSLAISPKLLHVVINALPSLPSLQRWHLNLGQEKKPWNCPPLKREDVTRLRYFSLALNHPSGETFKGVSNVLGYDDALCQVETASFSLVSYPTHPQEPDNIHMLLCLVRNAHHLQFWDIVPVKATSQNGDSHGGTISMPNLTYLYIRYTALMLPIDAPRLLMLGISSREDQTADNPPLRLPETFGQSVVKLEVRWEDFNKLTIESHNPWSSVQNVRWVGINSSSGSSTISFQSITSVDFMGSRYIPHNPDSAINRLLIAILRYPSACPNLRILKSGEYPIWELLFTTLSQRNQNKDVTGLEEIHLPALPVRPLLSLVVKLPSGDYNSNLIRNIDDTILRRFHHRLINACSFCMSAGYIYCTSSRRSPPLDSSHLWWQEQDDGSRHDRRSEQNYLELLDLDSQDLCAKLRVCPVLNWKEWEERLGEMSLDWRKSPEGITRKEHCPRHNFETLERINKYTLDGTER